MRTLAPLATTLPDQPSIDHAPPVIVGVAPSCWKWLTNEDISECKAADIADHNEQLFDNAVKPYLGMSVKGWVYYQGEKYASPSLAPAGPFFSRRRQRALLESARAAAPKKAASGEAACADPAVSVSVGPCSNCGGLHGNSGTKTQPPSGYACMMYGTELWRPLFHSAWVPPKRSFGAPVSCVCASPPLPRISY